MADPAPPPGYEYITFWHQNHSPCPMNPYAPPAPVSLLVPIDKDIWSGAFCNACKQQLVPA